MSFRNLCSKQKSMVNQNSNKISESLLLAVKMKQETTVLTSSLEKTSLVQLQKYLSNDDSKKAFWINIYNAFFQILRKEKQVEKAKIYTIKAIAIAGQKWSLDDIEHGILRKYRYKYSLGFLPNPFAASLIKKMAVAKIDYRIHFALNCGAKSCPPIAFYSAEKINQQLELATLSFLETETDVFADKKELHVTTLFKWFFADFGGRKGIRQIIAEKLNIETKGYKIIYKPYSWEEVLENYEENSTSKGNQ